MIKRKLLITVVAVITVVFGIFSLAACSSSFLGDDLIVMLLNGEGYSVDGDNVASINKNGKTSFNIILDDTYGVYYWSEGVYDNGVLTVDNIKRSTTIEIFTKKLAFFHYDSDKLAINFSCSDNAVFCDSFVTLEMNFTKENFRLDNLYLNGEELSFVKKDGKYFSDITLKQVENNITFVGDGDIVDGIYIYNNSENFGTATIQKEEGFIHIGDMIKVVADKKIGGKFNYFCINYKYYFEEETYVAITDNSNFIISDFVSEDAKKVSVSANGGIYEDGVPDNLSFDTGTYVNLNWFVGRLFRQGYNLSGLNTKADGTGKEYSLGALITIPNCATILYAQWEKQSSPEYFTHIDNEDGTISISGLSDYAVQIKPRNLVLPNYLGGKAVTKVGDRAFYGFDFIDTISLSTNIQTIGQEAFANSSIVTLKFYDSITFIPNNILVNCANFKNLRVNANTPRTFTYINWAYLAQKIMWYANCKEKTIVTLSGCSKVFGIDGDLLLSEFPDYTYAQIGVNGAGGDIYNLYELIKPYIKADDIIILSPEYNYKAVNSSYEKAIITAFMWEAFEANYDLLRNLDMSKYCEIFNSYNTIANLKKVALDSNDLYISSGAYAIGSHTIYGNTAFYRPNNDDDYRSSDGSLDTSIINEYSISRFNELYQDASLLGAKVFYVFAPINENCLSDEQKAAENLEAFEERIRQSYDIPLISVLSSHILPGKYFYDHNNHLTSEGATIDTETFIQELKAQLQK